MSPLRGLAWSHTRAMAPLMSLAWVLRDRAGLEVVEWQTRPLQSFGEEPLDRFTADFDLIVFDYPFAGEAMAQDWLLPLDAHLTETFLADRRRAVVGRCLDSFVYRDQLAGLPLDAACYVRAWRPDLMQELEEPLPRTFTETIDLAKRTGRVALPLTPASVWGGLLSLCANEGSLPLREGECAFAEDCAYIAFEKLRRLADQVPAWCFESSPVAVMNRMSEHDDVAYCPLAYGYSVYAMAGFARHRLKFGNAILGDTGRPDGAVLGGAGIGVSARSCRVDEALEVARWLTDPHVQSTLYAQFGGQPAASRAWGDPTQNLLTEGFYADTRGGIDACFHRPNRPGFHAFQTRSIQRLHRTLRDAGDPRPTFAAIEQDWRALTQ